ncbi:MAG: peptidase M20 [Robiginitomaculum sp.]|nr:MAG: peptidase M20 [Robiginitomaculum sp.]
MLKKTTIALMISVLFFATALADDKTERAIVNAVEQNMPTALATLERSVNINSDTKNFAGVKQVGEIYGAELKALGFDVQWIDGADFNRAGHLVADRGIQKPKMGLKILLIGHLDTVFAKSDNFQTYEKLPGGNVKGPGITDMKGGDVIIIAAVRALKVAGVLDNISLKIVMTGDEESSGRPLSKSKAALIEAAIWADIALGFEDGDGNIKTAVTSRRGSVDWHLTVTGRAAHSSQIFTSDVGYGAVLEAARILNAYREQLSDIPNLSFNPGRIVGGTQITHEKGKSTSTTFGKNNVVAQTLMVTGGIRAISPKQLADAKAKMQAITKNNLHHTSAVLTFRDGYPPMAPTDGNAKLLALYSDISQSLGYGKIVAVDPRRAGAADISFTAKYVDGALDGLGLMGTGGHTKDETADMTSFQKNTEKAAILIYRLSLED